MVVRRRLRLGCAVICCGMLPPAGDDHGVEPSCWSPVPLMKGSSRCHADE